MAGHLMTWARRQVFKQLKLSSTQRFVLLLLADNGSWDEDTETWSAKPFQKTLAEEADTDVRTVQRALKELENKGVLFARKRYRAGGAPAGNEYFFNVAVVENPIVAVGNIPADSRPDTVPPLENSRDDIVSPTPSDPHDFKTRHCAAPVDNSGRGDTSVGSEATPVSGPARERKPARRASLNPHKNQYSSSSSSGEFSPPKSVEPAADAAGVEEEPLRGADLREAHSQGTSAASGDVHSDVAHQHPKAERPVDLAEVTRALRDVPAIREWFTGRPETTSLLTGWVDQVLDRASDPVIGQPTGLVIAAARRNPTRTREELNRLANPVSVQTTSERPRPRKCPIPAHAALGNHQANCPECRDLTGEGNFPPAIDTGIYAELSEAGRKNIDRYGVPVHRHVDHEDLLRTLSWAEHRRAA